MKTSLNKDQIVIEFDYDVFELARRGFGAQTPCPKCKYPCAQQLLTSFLCANHHCDNYDKKYFADALKMHIQKEIKNPAGARILSDQIKVIPVEDHKFDIVVPFVMET